MKWPEFDSQDDVPERFRELYHEKDGKWVAKEGEGSELGDAGKKAIAKERAAREAAEKKAKAAEAEAERLKLEAEAKGAGLTDEKLAEIRKQAETEAAKKYSDYDDAKAENRRLKLDLKVKATALKDGGVRPDLIEDWWALHESHFDLTDDGTPIVKDDPTKDVTAYITGELKKAKSYLYTGSKGDGPGSGGINDPKGAGGGALTLEEVLKNPERALGEQGESAA